MRKKRCVMRRRRRWWRRTQLLKNSLILSVGAIVKKVLFVDASLSSRSACAERTHSQYFWFSYWENSISFWCPTKDQHRRSQNLCIRWRKKNPRKVRYSSMTLVIFFPFAYFNSHAYFLFCHRELNRILSFDENHLLLSSFSLCFFSYVVCVEYRIANVDSQRKMSDSAQCHLLLLWATAKTARGRKKSPKRSEFERTDLRFRFVSVSL